ncbi:hypothetical protein CYMTET_42205 [Cymbomonas tetramitiformis]|uniref:Uncharacterized protein n=1 Tax=Cymbomonas tetramitiformis TaxID=36881 RepID=A0AAE0C6I9_9CHLO|nr:hypothetical protein CYMTET_42205 [Cymbomonas tetramitiformis]
MEERQTDEQASAPRPVEVGPAVHPAVLPPEPSSPPAAPGGDFGCMAALAGLFRHAGEAFTSPSRVGTKKARSPQQPGSEERARTAPRPRVAVDEGGGDEVGAAGPAAAATAERGGADEEFRRRRDAAGVDGAEMFGEHAPRAGGRRRSLFETAVPPEVRVETDARDASIRALESRVRELEVALGAANERAERANERAERANERAERAERALSDRPSTSGGRDVAEEVGGTSEGRGAGALVVTTTTATRARLSLTESRRVRRAGMGHPAPAIVAVPTVAPGAIMPQRRATRRLTEVFVAAPTIVPPPAEDEEAAADERGSDYAGSDEDEGDARTEDSRLRESISAVRTPRVYGAGSLEEDHAAFAFAQGCDDYERWWSHHLDGNPLVRAIRTGESVTVDGKTVPAHCMLAYTRPYPGCKPPVACKLALKGTPAGWSLVAWKATRTGGQPVEERALVDVYGNAASVGAKLDKMETAMDFAWSTYTSPMPYVRLENSKPTNVNFDYFDQVMVKPFKVPETPSELLVLCMVNFIIAEFDQRTEDMGLYQDLIWALMLDVWRHGWERHVLAKLGATTGRRVLFDRILRPLAHQDNLDTNLAQEVTKKSFKSMNLNDAVTWLPVVLGVGRLSGRGRANILRLVRQSSVRDGYVLLGKLLPFADVMQFSTARLSSFSFRGEGRRPRAEHMAAVREARKVLHEAMDGPIVEFVCVAGALDPQEEARAVCRNWGKRIQDCFTIREVLDMVGEGQFKALSFLDPDRLATANRAFLASIVDACGRGRTPLYLPSLAHSECVGDPGSRGGLVDTSFPLLMEIHGLEVFVHSTFRAFRSASHFRDIDAGPRAEAAHTVRGYLERFRSIAALVFDEPNYQPTFPEPAASVPPAVRNRYVPVVRLSLDNIKAGSMQPGQLSLGVERVRRAAAAAPGAAAVADQVPFRLWCCGSALRSFNELRLLHYGEQLRLRGLDDGAVGMRTPMREDGALPEEVEDAGAGGLPDQVRGCLVCTRDTSRPACIDIDARWDRLGELGSFDVVTSLLPLATDPELRHLFLPDTAALNLASPRARSFWRVVFMFHIIIRQNIGVLRGQPSDMMRDA